MASLMNYQDGNAAMLMLETQQRAIGTKTAAANGDTSSGEPPSSLINLGGARFHQHLPPSYEQTIQSRERHQQANHFQSQQQCPGEAAAAAGAPVRKPSSSSLNLAHEDAAALAASAAPALPAAGSDGADDIRKCGYMRKQKHGHKRFFVLRGASHLGHSRLEYYDSEKKFRNSLRFAAAGGAAAAASPPKRIICLYQCFTVNKRADSKHKYLIALYTKDDYFAIVAENEREQEEWYQALSDLMNESKRGHLDADDLEDMYGAVSPVTVFKEVWQVNVKPKGLGQTKNLTGVYRLCLSSKTLHLVKLNSETPSVSLQLMNIRRCGHSESFFFIEVGRSSSTGPGEIWMQVEDSVVAQSMHETILETMKALKAFVDFRPRSKSQSSGSNPVAFITTRRHLGNLPPSQTGLQRRSRTESVVGTPSSCKGGSAYRFRTSSEGEGTMSRPFRSATGSLIHLNMSRGSLGRQDGTGRYSRAPSGSSYHMRSASLPVSHFSYATSPVSVSSSSGHGSASDTLTQPSSASLCGSPSDGGFNSSDEYGSSPGDLRYIRVRSGTPDSLSNTPPIREESCLSEYMAMYRYRETWGGPETTRDESCDEEKVSWKQGHASRPTGAGVTVFQKTTQTTSLPEESAVAPAASPLGSNGSAFLKSGFSCYAEQPCSAKSSLCPDQHRIPPRDDGYMPMMPGVVPSQEDNYVPMQPSPRHPLPSQVQATEQTPPQQLETQGYMMMLPGTGDHPQSGEYMDMSHSFLPASGHRLSRGCHTQTLPKSPRPYSPYSSLPRSYKAPIRESHERDEYVRMRSPAKHPAAECGPSSPPDEPPSPLGSNGQSSSDRWGPRPSRLPLDRHDRCGAPGGREARNPPSSPGENINVEFGNRPAESSVFSPECAGDDYMSLEADEQPPKARSPRPSLVAPWNPPSYIRPQAGGAPADGYVEVSLGTGTRSPSGMLRQLSVAEQSEPLSRCRCSSEALLPSDSSAQAPASLYQLDDAKWLGSSTFDSVWPHVEGVTSPGAATLPVPTNVACNPNHPTCHEGPNPRDDLNYIALDLRQDRWSGHEASSPAPSTPPTTLPLSENSTYPGLDFARVDRLRSASQD
ncbi:insulin receptor substrate 2-B [Paramormyrops kingsleyae]|uniref:insulin receptor substrate 2-B n=1 Tax=Paramormyrops kingsleyae TaxID=1676925 RepID=UPI003B97192E